MDASGPANLPFGNPFNPNFGNEPDYLAERSSKPLRRFEDALRDFHKRKEHLRVIGPSGVGKTVLLNQYEAKAKAEQWVVGREILTQNYNDDDEFAKMMRELLKAVIGQLPRSAGRLAKGFSDCLRSLDGEVGVPKVARVGYRGRSIRERIADDSLKMALADTMYEAARLVVAADKRGLVLLLDEAQELTDEALLSCLFLAVHDACKRGASVMLVLAGRPPLEKSTDLAVGGTMFSPQVLEPLEMDVAAGETMSPAVKALVCAAEQVGTASTRITFNVRTAEQIALEAGGHPFIIQTYGWVLWAEAEERKLPEIDDDLLEKSRRRISAELDARFYKRVIRQSDAEDSDLTLLASAAPLGEPFTFTQLQTESGASDGGLTRALGRLRYENELIRVSGRAYYFNVPGLSGHLLRAYAPAR